MTDRAHLLRPVQDEAGNLLTDVSVRLLNPGTTDPIADPVYLDNTTVTATDLPYVCANGIISLYLDTPQRVRVGVTHGTHDEVFFEDIDVGAVGAGGSADTTHPGTGTDSTQVGVDATATATSSLALGVRAAATWEGTTALGVDATAAGLDSVAVGNFAAVSGTLSVGVGGYTYVVTDHAVVVGFGGSAGGYGTALGYQSFANNQNVAVGANANAAIADGGAVAIGRSAHVSGQHGIAIGRLASADYDEGVAVGYGSGAGGDGTTVGTLANASTSAVAVGKSAFASPGGVALGAGAVTHYATAIAIGNGAENNDSNSALIKANVLEITPSLGDNSTLILVDVNTGVRQRISVVSGVLTVTPA